MPLFTSPTTPLDSLLDRPRPGPWEQFLSNPCIFLARKLYTWYQAIPATPLTKPISIVCVSDTHNSQPKLPEGDILIHAGDLTQSGSLAELRSSVNWLRTQSHPIKVVIAGNHDFLLDASRDDSSSSSDKAAAAAASERESIDWGDIIYLENKETTITCPNGRNLRIYGSPFSPRHGNWAFQYPRGYDIWSSIRIPEGIDILVTHAPPRAHLDLLGLGCVHLLRALWRVRPRVHVFGHVHEGAGVEWVLFDRLQEKYERVVVDGGGVWNLMAVVWEFAKRFWGSKRDVEAKCLLVNPSVVGGLRDYERRGAVRVVI